MGKIGCFVGLFVVYILPVMTYLKNLKEGIIKMQNEISQICTKSDYCIQNEGGQQYSAPLVQSIEVQNKLIKEN